jgi:hypothetical protein
MRQRISVPLLLAFLGICLLPEAAAQRVEVPEGINGVLYYCPRLDLVPPEAGGPLSVVLDGETNDAIWSLARWHTWTQAANQNDRGDPRPPDFVPVTPEDDLTFEWAAAADTERLYVAWRVTDDIVVNSVQRAQCSYWRDDAVELYIDARNNGPDCSLGRGSCYQIDDAQLLVGAHNLGTLDPDAILFGGLADYRRCDFSGPHPELLRGVVAALRAGPDEPQRGWQAEVAIALETLGNVREGGPDGTPTWSITPDHGTYIGFNLHSIDDDDGEADEQHRLIWSTRDPAPGRSVNNPGRFGKLMFLDPTREPPPFTDPVQSLACARQADGTVLVRWTNPENSDPTVPIRILADGQTVLQVDGSATEASLAEASVPRDGRDHLIQVANQSGQIAECDVIQFPFDRCGGIRMWNILGAFDTRSGVPPITDMQRDYMRSTDVSELDFVWFPGATIATDFGGLDGSCGGSAASCRVMSGATGRNPDGVPQVYSRVARSGAVSFQLADTFGADLNRVMAYAQTYVTVEEERDVFLGISSDDSIQVILNGQEVFIRSVARGNSTACDPFDEPPDPVRLAAGTNSLIAKVFETSSSWDFAIRFQDAAANPVTDGIAIQLTPPPERPLVRFARGDADADGIVGITDAVLSLLYLFRDGAPPACLDAADVDDNARLRVDDAVLLLLWLFAGGAPPAPPSPSKASDCGPDPTDGDGLGCATTAEVCRV